MKNLIFVLILGAVLGEIKVIPYPKHVETGSDILKFSRCELNLESFIDQPFAEILDVHKEIIMGNQRPCQPDAPKPITVKVMQRQRLSGSDCASEEYELEITKQGIFMTSQCPVGLVRALSTLEQLIEKHKDSQHGEEVIVIKDIPIKISDEPRFSYRGIMIDSARHFLEINVLQKIINGMMLAKLNVFHWHIADDDSFPMQSKHIPGLGEDGAFTRRELYTVQDIKNLIQYAKARGVRIIPEIDVPGHSRAIGKHQPLNDIVTCYNSPAPHNLRNYYRIRGGPPGGALDPTMNKTYEFMDKILRDLKDYFEDDLIHLGGDEVPYRCWLDKQSIVDFMKEHGFKEAYELQIYFMQKARELLKNIDNKKRVIYWSDQATYKLKYSSDDILQFWGPSTEIPKLKDMYPNNSFILSPSDYLYLDCGVGNKYGGRSWCDPYKTWLKIYQFEPTNYSLPESNILGAEAPAWAEQIDDFNIELKLWPRVLSLAERLWMPKNNDPINLGSLIKRLNAFSAKLRERGIPSNPVTRQYCEIHMDECYGNI